PFEASAPLAACVSEQARARNLTQREERASHPRGAPGEPRCVLRCGRPMVSGVAQGPLVGQVLSGKYRILAKLGEGAMAGVYLAEHLGVGATIVLKVLLPELAEEPEFVESFLREARIAAEIHHDNVIDIFYSGRSPEGFVFLAMEYVKGSTLFDVL